MLIQDYYNSENYISENMIKLQITVINESDFAKILRLILDFKKFLSYE